MKSEDNKESLRPLLQEVVLPKSKNVNLYNDEIKTKKIVGSKKRKGLEKEIEKARNQSRKNSTPQGNGELIFLQRILPEYGLVFFEYSASFYVFLLISSINSCQKNQMATESSMKSYPLFFRKSRWLLLLYVAKHY